MRLHRGIGFSPGGFERLDWNSNLSLLARLQSSSRTASLPAACFCFCFVVSAAPFASVVFVGLAVACAIAPGGMGGKPSKKRRFAERALSTLSISQNIATAGLRERNADEQGDISDNQSE